MSFTCNSVINLFRRNLYTLKENSILAFSLLVFTVLEQMTIKLCEILSETYEPDVLFTIWWSVHLLDKIIFINFKNIYVFISASREFPEFLGHYGKPFPGKMKPRTPSFTVKRGKKSKKNIK